MPLPPLIQQGFIAYGTFVSTGGELGVNLQCGAHFTWALGRWFPAFFVLLMTTMCEFFCTQVDINRTVRDIDVDNIAIPQQADGTAGSGFRRAVTNRQTRGTAGEAAVGQQRTGFAQTLGFQVRGRVQHFLHTRATFRTFVADNDDITGFYFIGQNAFYRIVLAFKDFRLALEYQNGFIHTGGFYHAAIQCDVAVQNRQAAFFRIGAFQITDTAVFTVAVQRWPTGALAECGLGRDTSRTGFIELHHLFARVAHDVPLIQRFFHGFAVNGWQVIVQQTGAVDFTQNTHDATGTVYVFHMVQRRVWRHFTQLRNHPRQTVDVFQIEVALSFLSRSQQVQNGVG